MSCSTFHKNILPKRSLFTLLLSFLWSPTRKNRLPQMFSVSTSVECGHIGRFGDFFWFQKGQSLVKAEDGCLEEVKELLSQRESTSFQENVIIKRGFAVISSILMRFKLVKEMLLIWTGHWDLQHVGIRPWINVCESSTTIFLASLAQEWQIN